MDKNWKLIFLFNVRFLLFVSVNGKSIPPRLLRRRVPRDTNSGNTLLPASDSETEDAADVPAVKFDSSDVGTLAKRSISSLASINTPSGSANNRTRTTKKTTKHTKTKRTTTASKKTTPITTTTSTTTGTSTASTPPSTTLTTSMASTFTTFQTEALAQSNIYRAVHCAPNLVYNASLNALVQAYAQKLADTKIFAHSNNG